MPSLNGFQRCIPAKVKQLSLEQQKLWDVRGSVSEHVEPFLIQLVRGWPSTKQNVRCSMSTNKRGYTASRMEPRPMELTPVANFTDPRF